MRFRRRRRTGRTRWLWADSGQLTIIGGTNAITVLDCFPTGMIRWRNNERPLVVKRMLWWLNFYVTNRNLVSAATYNVPPCNFYITKTSRDVATVEAADFQPFGTPATPAAATSWETDDGLDSQYLWCHRWFPAMNANTVLSNNPQLNGGLTDGSANLQMLFQSGAGYGDWGYVQGTWRPQLDLRVKRRMNRGEHLIFGMALDPGTTLTAGFEYSLRYSVKVLA